MRELVILIISLLAITSSVFFLGNNSDVKQNGFKNQQYKLVWADEFNREGRPDSLNWNFETGFVRNEELQWYQPENAYCKNGCLIIEARKEERDNPDYIEGINNWKRSRKKIEYTSSCLITAGKRSWLYGRFEMRARIGISEGLWPAWWCLGIDKRWPACGEIDMMEYYRGKLLANILCQGKENEQEWHSTTASMKSLGDSVWASRFHTWRMDWTKESISLYVDDFLLNKMPVDSLVNKDGSGFNPFRQPQYMLVNLAIGGQNGGNPEHTIFPSKFEIDYLRVYQLSE